MTRIEKITEEVKAEVAKEYGYSYPMLEVMIGIVISEEITQRVANRMSEEYSAYKFDLFKQWANNFEPTDIKTLLTEFDYSHRGELYEQFANEEI